MEALCCTWRGCREAGAVPGDAEFRMMWGPAEVTGRPKLGLEEPPGGSLEAWRLLCRAGAEPPGEATVRPQLGLEILA